MVPFLFNCTTYYIGDLRINKGKSLYNIRLTNIIALDSRQTVCCRKPFPSHGWSPPPTSFYPFPGDRSLPQGPRCKPSEWDCSRVPRNSSRHPPPTCWSRRCTRSSRRWYSLWGRLGPDEGHPCFDISHSDQRPGELFLL